MLFASEHPLVRHKVALLRHVDTEPKKFRELVRELSMLLCVEATRDLDLNPETVPTPMGTAGGEMLRTKIGLVPILRAGLGFVHAAQELLPDADVGFVGISRDEQTFAPMPYVNKLPESLAGRPVIVVDPMLATGGSLVHTVELLRERDALGRVTVGTDTPSGTGIAPRGMLRTLALMTSLGGVPPAEALCLASGNTARAHGLETGFIRPGAPADLLLVGRIGGSSGADALDGLAHGDLPGISTVMVDGEILVRDFELTRMDATEVTAQGREAALELARRARVL
jgi:uracil phosphoribosyltransferase